MGKIELLAPAGSPKTLRAVLAAGADAVYLGGAQFGARAYAKNFTEDELLDAIDYTHLMGKKLHLTVNTLLKSKELEEQLYGYFLPFYERGVDAVIVQDAGVFSFMRKHFPDVALHVSTQMSVAGADGADFWKRAGAERIVLARELSTDEIRHIHERVDIELECFAHGALCYCYSGQCLFSSMLGGRSGNRGRCAQPCRLPYTVTGDARAGENAGVFCGGTCIGSGEKSGKRGINDRGVYPLSLKDLCAIDLLPELLRAGISSLKIEGRMKQEAYAAGVTGIYRKYLDLLENRGAKDYAVAESDRRLLSAFGNRSGFTSGYLRGETGRTMVSLHSPKHMSEDTQWVQPEEKRRQIRGSFLGAPGEALALTLTDKESGISVTAEGSVAEAAQRASACASDVERVLRQTGDTVFEVGEFEIGLADGCFIPKQFLKSLRRQAIGSLQEKLLGSYKRCAPEYISYPDSLESMEAHPDCVFGQSPSNSETDWNHIFVVCDTMEQIRVCARRAFVQTIALQLHSFREQELVSALTEAGGLCHASGKGFVLALPAIMREETVRMYERMWTCIEKLQKDGQIKGFLAKSYDGLGFLERMGVGQGIWLDSPLYTFSGCADAYFRGMGYGRQTLPLELNAKELRHRAGEGSILTVYGHVPFMVSAQCVNKTMSGCDRKGKLLFLSDRYGKRLPVKNYCSVCYNVIYNAVPTVLFDGAVRDAVERIMPSLLRMDFTVEDERTMDAVLTAYEACAIWRGDDTFPGEMTRGHFKRGVE